MFVKIKVFYSEILIIIPVQTAKTPKITLNAMCKSAKNVFPDWNNFMFSRAKAEKVVNPPQKPVMNNNLKSGLVSCSFMISPANIPTIKQPAAFTKNVAQGKEL